MKITLALSFVVLLISTQISISHAQVVTSDRAADDTSRKVMQHWVGNWTGGVASAADTTVPHIATVPDHAEVEWTLDNHFLHGTNLDKENKPVGIWLMRYNPKTDKYQVSFFTSQGDVSVWNGAWDEKKQTMTWETRDAEMRVTGSGHTTFANHRQEWTMSITKDGKTEKSSGSLTHK
jgi:hypothetical protein